MAERFHIAEWYGRPFLDLQPLERVRLAQHRVGAHTMKKTDVNRLIALQEKAAIGGLTVREQARLDVSTALMDQHGVVAEVSV